MTVERDHQAGVKVYFDADECELFVKLALDAAAASQAETPHTYFDLSVKLGRKINALRPDQSFE
jgi:hypothetical protein